MNNWSELKPKKEVKYSNKWHRRPIAEYRQTDKKRSD